MSQNATEPLRRVFSLNDSETRFIVALKMAVRRVARVKQALHDERHPFSCVK
jgi:hypothetical protein